MYTRTNYKTKKSLKEDVAAGKTVEVYDNSMFASGKPINGRATVEGPHYPEPHKWYAQVIVEDNVIVSVW